MTCLPGFIDGLKIDKLIPVSNWADMHRVLNAKSASEPGYWKTSRTPYLQEIMDSLSPLSPVETVTWMKSAQVGATETGNNWVSYVVDMAPGPMMVVQPTVDMAKRWSKQRFAPMIFDMPKLSGKIKESRSRDSGNTTLLKEFYGGMLIITGANSAASLRSMPVRYLFLDEVDGYPLDVDGEGDPIELARNRTKTFANKKTFMTSTPTTSGVSRIEREFKKGDQRYYYVPCPHCGTMQNLDWQFISYKTRTDGTAGKTVYICGVDGGCGAEIEEHHKTKMLAGGEWVATNPDAQKKNRSYHLNALYSPLGWESWQDIATKFLETKDNIELLKTWKNTSMAETYKEKVNEINGDDLQSRAEKYPLGIVPERALVLTCGVDVQDNRLEAEVVGWGRKEESWTVDMQVFDGDPGLEDVWGELFDYITTAFPHAAGGDLMIEATAIDTGGHHTHEVYNFARTNKHLGVIAIKGASVRNKPILGRASMVDVDWRGRVIKNGVQLWMVGTDTAKSTIYARMKKPAKEDGEINPGYMHFSDELPTEYFDQMVAEKYASRYIKGIKIYEWVNPNKARNEMLDCRVYSYTAALKLGIHRWGENKWSEKEGQVMCVTGDLFAAKKTSNHKSKKKEIKGPEPW